MNPIFLLLEGNQHVTFILSANLKIYIYWERIQSHLITFQKLKVAELIINLSDTAWSYNPINYKSSKL